MSSWVLFKFKSQKEPTRITFDGTGITVFELKREIINVSQLGDGADFDLHIHDESTNEEYDDDTVIVPRASMVIASRKPALRPGHGKAARYVSGRMPANYRRNDHRLTTTGPSNDALAAMDNAKTEQERIAAMFAAEGDQWAKQQQEMAHAKPVHYKPNQQKRPAFADKPLPPGYICHRCQQKGHWIYDCPTNEDPDFKPKPKLKKTTGIPRSFLEKVDKSEIMDEDEDGKAPKGYMMDGDGNRVRVKTDTATWEKEQARQKATAAKKEAAAEENRELKERGLECPIDTRLFEVPTKTPCCGKTYCHTCIEDALVNNDLVCPNCGQDNVLIDDLLPDNDMALKIKAYREEKEAEAKAKEQASQKAEAERVEEARKASEAAEAAVTSVETKEGDSKPVRSPKPDDSTTETSDEKLDPADAAKRSASPAGSSTSAQKIRASSSESSSKKRPAEDELQNERIPKAPAAMRKQQEIETLSQNGLNPQFLEDMEKLSNGGFPNMTQQQQNSMGRGAMLNNMGMPMNMHNPMPMNPMMNPMAMMGMPGMPMPNMMNGMSMGMSMPNMMGGNMAGGNMAGGNMGFNNGFNGNFNNNRGNWQGQQQNWNHGPQRGGYQNGAGRGFQNNNFAGGANGFVPNGNGANFNKQHPNEEDNAYFRQPVNPHRHQKQKRMRPSEYTEL